MFRNLCALVFLCALLAPGASAKGEHLVPEPSIYTDIIGYEYHSKVVKFFGHDKIYGNIFGFGPGAAHRFGRLPIPQAAMIAVPAFAREYRVGLVEKDGGFTVTFERPEIMIFAFLIEQKKLAEREAKRDARSAAAPPEEELTWWQKKIIARGEKLPETVEDIRMERCERGVDKALAEKLRLLWYNMLRQTRYPDEEHGGFDGVTYHFTLHWRGPAFGMGGQIWSPPEESKTGRLVAITDTMRRYCLEGGAEIARQLEQKADDLLKRLGG